MPGIEYKPYVVGRSSYLPITGSLGTEDKVRVFSHVMEYGKTSPLPRTSTVWDTASCHLLLPPRILSRGGL